MSFNMLSIAFFKMIFTYENLFEIPQIEPGKQSLYQATLQPRFEQIKIDSALKSTSFHIFPICGGCKLLVDFCPLGQKPSGKTMHTLECISSPFPLEFQSFYLVLQKRTNLP